MSSVKQLTVNDFYIKDNNVYLTKDAFTEEPGILFVWATWCGHCVAFKPTFETIANKLSTAKDTFQFVALESTEFDSEKGQKLSDAMKITGYPTLLWCMNNKIIGQYSGARTEKDILNNICDMYHHCIKYHS